jgi:hypothetical protein
MNRRSGFARVAAVVQVLDELLSSERNQHADDDDADLAGEFAPAVQRLGQMEMHQMPRSAGVAMIGLQRAIEITPQPESAWP